MALLAIIAGAVAARFWYTHRDEQRLAAMRGALAARGEPVRPREFRADPPPAGENAATALRLAIAAWHRAFPQDSPARGGAAEADANSPPAGRIRPLLELLGEGLATSRNLRRAHRQEVREILARSKDTMPYLRAARRCPSVDWGLDYDGDAFRWGLAELEDVWDVCDLPLLAAGAACDAGAPAEAMEHLRDAQAIAAAAGALGRYFEFAEADRMRERVCLAVEDAAPSLSGPAAAAARTAAVGLIADLLADDGFSHAIQVERTILLDILDRLRWGDLRLDEALLAHRRDRGLGRLIRTVRVGDEATVRFSDEVRMLEEMAEYLAAARAATYPQAMAALQRAWSISESAASRSVVSMFLPEAGRTYKLRFRTLAFRRMAAAALAIRLYELDAGRPPADLAALAPRYLPAAPADPFATRAGPIAFRPRSDPPRLSSVFDDGRDEDGDFLIGPSGRVDLIDSPDLVFFLDGNRPEPPAPPP